MTTTRYIVRVGGEYLQRYVGDTYRTVKSRRAATEWLNKPAAERAIRGACVQGTIYAEKVIIPDEPINWREDFHADG